MASVLRRLEFFSFHSCNLAVAGVAMWSLILLCAFLMYYFVKRKSFKPHLYPPGPPSLPIIGNLLSVWVELKKLKYHHCVWQAWSQKYGDIVGLQLGFTKVVVVSGKDLIKEVSNREVFEGRPDGFMYLMRSFGKKMGIVFADGKSWQATRRVVLKCLKNFGYGTSSMEAYIAEEAAALVNLRIEDERKPVLVNHMFDVSIINVLWRLVAGKRYELNDRRLLDLCEMISRTFKIVDMSGGLLTFMPFLRHIIPGLIGYTEFRDINIRLYSFLRKVIDQHRTSVYVNNPRDVIDAFLIEMMENKNEAFTDEELQVVCLDLLESGTETVSNSLVFMILHLVREQDVQRKVQQEIDDTIGHARSPALSDRNKMVYTEAVLMEVLRISSVAPVGIPHMALEDARLGEYVIPKGTFVLLAMHDLHNGRHWKDPNTFRPERFLTKDGNLIQDEWLMPFGTGKRRCIGEGLARSELFMFMTHLLQKFNIRVPDGDPMPSTEIVNGLTLSAKPFHVVFKQRF